MNFARRVFCAVSLTFGLILPVGAVPPFPVPLPEALEKADFAGVVRVTDVPPAPKGGFRATAPPVVEVSPVAVLKGEPRENLRIVWQTHYPSCYIRDPATIEVFPPTVGAEYMVFLTRGRDGLFARLGYEWHFHRMPTAPTARVQSSDAWRCLIEVFPAVAGSGEVVQYRLTRTRLAAEAWEGTESNLVAADMVVVDFTRKKCLMPVKSESRAGWPTVIVRGETVVDVIDLTAAFGITGPGEYWVFGGGAAEGNAPLRFEVTDRFRLRAGKPNRPR